MAGFWHLSHSQLKDLNGNIYAGAKAYFFEAATLNPITVYQDYGLGTAHSNPVVANAYGIFPPVFLDEDDGFYRQRITSSGGIIIPGTDVVTLPIIGPSVGGGGAEVPVDPNTLFQTGDVHWLDKSGARPGWVRDNGRTIGSATSGASERAAADVEPLFGFLWDTYPDAKCPVSGGRGLNPAADFAATKTIGLPDKRGRGPFGLDDMGNTAAGRLASALFVGSDTATTVGGVGGAPAHTLLAAEIPTLNVSVTGVTSGNYPFGGNNVNVNTTSASATVPDIAPLPSALNVASTGTTTNTSGSIHNNMPPFVLGTFYRKL